MKQLRGRLFIIILNIDWFNKECKFKGKLKIKGLKSISSGELKFSSEIKLLVFLKRKVKCLCKLLSIQSWFKINILLLNPQVSCFNNLSLFIN